MRTTVKRGREGGASGTGRTGVKPLLDRARDLFAGLSGSLEREIERLQDALEIETDASRIKGLNDLIRLNQKTLHTVLEEELKLSRESDNQQAGRDVIDLAEARAEIGRRLDRLAG